MSDIIEIQKQIIGILIVYPESISEVYDILKPEHFGSAGIERVYRAILHLYNTGKPITAPLIVEECVDENRTAESIMHGIVACINIVSTSAPIVEYANILRNEHRAKKARSILHNIESIDRHNVDDEIGNAINALTELANGVDNGSKTIQEIIKEHSYKFFNPDYNPKYLYTGFFKLDSIIAGIEDTDLVCIGARPSVGKSAFVLQIARNISRNKKVIFYSMEMNSMQILKRMIASEGEINATRLKTAKKFQNDEQKRLQMAIQSINNRNLIINDKGSKKVSEIRNECKFINDLGAIIIDYLQLIIPERETGNRNNDVGSISRSLKCLAMELHVPIIMLAQLNRANSTRSEKKPLLSDLRDSGNIEQDCNEIFFIWNPEEENGVTDIKEVDVAKSRDGDLGTVFMRFKGDNLKFYEINNYKPMNNPPPKKKEKNDGFMALADDEEMPFN